MTSARDESTVGPEVVLGTQAGLRKGIGHLSAQQHKGENREAGRRRGLGPLISLLSTLESLSFSHVQESGVGL